MYRSSLSKKSIFTMASIAISPLFPPAKSGSAPQPIHRFFRENLPATIRFRFLILEGVGGVQGRFWGNVFQPNRGSAPRKSHTQNYFFDFGSSGQRKDEQDIAVYPCKQADELHRSKKTRKIVFHRHGKGGEQQHFLPAKAGDSFRAMRTANQSKAEKSRRISGRQWFLCESIHHAVRLPAFVDTTDRADTPFRQANCPPLALHGKRASAPAHGKPRAQTRHLQVQYSISPL